MASYDPAISDDEEIEENWRSQKFGNRRKIVNRIIDSSEDEEEEEKLEELSSSEEDEILDSLDKFGRTSPSIAKAIRRSIHNLSLHANLHSDDDTPDDVLGDESEINESTDYKSSKTNKIVETDEEDEEDEDYDESVNQSNPSNHDANKEEKTAYQSVENSFEYSIVNSSRAATEEDTNGKESANSTRSILQSSHDESKIVDLTASFAGEEKQKSAKQKNVKNSVILDVSSDFVSSSPEISVVESDESFPQRQNGTRPNSILRTPKNNLSSSLEMISVESASEASSIIEEEHPELVTMAKEELKGVQIDHKRAQERALLTYKRDQLRKDLSNMEMLTKSPENLGNLPDQGQKLLLRVQIQRQALTRVEEKLEELKNMDKSILNSPLPILSRNPEVEELKVRSPNYDDDILILDKPTADLNIDGFGKKAMKTFETQQTLTVDRLHDLHGSLVHRPAENEEALDPRGLRIKLMPHQKHALAWLQWREKQKPSGGVLADDMGLGKTLTMISLVLVTKDESNSDDDDDEWIRRSKAKYNGGTLVVCPASLIAQWAAEIKNRCKAGELIVDTYHGNNRSSKARMIARNDVVITTYQLLAREFKAGGNNATMYTIQWKRVILDEAHVIRNHKSQTCEAICGLHAKRRWALTGTPIHNKELDLFSILKFLRCSPFDDIKVWKRWVDNKNAAGHQRLATVMKSLMLRRTKDELMMKGTLEVLPEKALEEIKIDLDPDERLIYEKLLVYSQTLFAQFLAQRAEKEHMFELGAGRFDKPFMEMSSLNTKFNKAQKELLRQHGEIKSHTILALILRLRQVCCHPSLIHAMLDRDDIEQNAIENDTTSDDILSRMNRMQIHDTDKDYNDDDDDDDDGDIGVDDRVRENLLTKDNPVFKKDRLSSKLKVLLDLVKDILKKKEKIIVVSQWTSNLDIIANHLNNVKGASYKLFTGSVAIKHRQKIVDEFNDPHDGPRILLLSLTAGGVGLNLVGANHLMLIDIHWNPQLESQAQDRIYRFGQKKNVFIYKFICNGTIEERIKNLQDHKLSLATNVLAGSGKVSSKLTIDDLRSLFSM